MAFLFIPYLRQTQPSDNISGGNFRRFVGDSVQRYFVNRNLYKRGLSGDAVDTRGPHSDFVLELRFIGLTFTDYWLTPWILADVGRR